MHAPWLARMATVSSTRAMAAALLLFTLVFTHHPCRSHALSIMNYLCRNRTSYALNSTYQSNVVALLSSLTTNASTSPVGFATGTAGHAPDQSWGLALCRGDTNATSCASCLSLLPNIAFGKCRGVRDVSIYYDRCLLRFSDTDFLATPDNENATGQVQFGVNKELNITSNPGRYVELAADLVDALSGWAANNSTRRYAAGVITSSSGEGFTTTSSDLIYSIYGLVQCTPDQSPTACQGCLSSLRSEMPALFNGTAAAQFNYVWCNLRYDVFAFYDGSPDVNLVASPPSPPPSLAPASQNTNRGKGSENAAIVIAIVLGVLVVALASAFIMYVWRKEQAKQYAKEDEDAGSLLFDLTTLRKATGNFAEENKLGHGGFGAVYKGFLPDGREIAVKRLDKASSQGLKELRNELLLVAKLRHNNLAKLLGVCLKGQEKLLVYEYLPNRSLDTFLFAPAAGTNLLLDWETRYRIIYGVARGLLYLHEDSQIKIIHRDLKASNILLDADMTPKISDFGLARLFIGDKTTTITSQVVGTLGYMAPEYAVLGHLSVKLDVYSFGVLILEIVTGRRNTDTFFESDLEEPSSLLSYVWDHWLKGTALETMDPSLKGCQGQDLESEVLKSIHLGLLCVQENPADRPTMLDILMMLHGQEESFAAPSKPAFAFGHAGAMMSSEAERDRVSGGPGNYQRAATAADAVFSANGMSVSEVDPR